MKKLFIALCLLSVSVEAKQYVGVAVYQDYNDFSKIDYSGTHNTRWALSYGMKGGDYRLDFEYGMSLSNTTYSYSTFLLSTCYDFPIRLYNDFGLFAGFVVGIDKGRINGGSYYDTDTGFIYGAQFGVSYSLTDRFNIDLTYLHQRFENIFEIRNVDYNETIIANSVKLSVRFSFGK